MTIDAAAEGLLRVVEVQHFQALESDQAAELRERLRVPVR